MDYGLQALKLIFGLFFLSAILRMLGKQSISQLTPYDLVYVIVFGGILDSTFYDDDIGIFPFLFSIIIWSLGIYIVEMLVSRNEKIRLFFRGRPEQILSKGKINLKSLKKNNLEMEQLRMMLRKQGVFSLQEVSDIYLETDGTISILKYKDYQVVNKKDLLIEKKEDEPNILLIGSGEIEIEALKYIDKTKEWLENELNKLGIEDISSVLYCEWSNKDGFYIKTEKDILVIRNKGYAN